jgi:hypothetical protein
MGFLEKWELFWERNLERLQVIFVQALEVISLEYFFCCKWNILRMWTSMWNWSLRSSVYGNVKGLHGEFRGWQCETAPCDGHSMEMWNWSMWWSLIYYFVHLFSHWYFNIYIYVCVCVCAVHLFFLWFPFFPAAQVLCLLCLSFSVTLLHRFILYCVEGKVVNYA